MSHACQAKAARRNARNGYRHVALLGRPVISRMSLEKSKARLAAKIATEQRIRKSKARLAVKIATEQRIRQGKKK